MILENNSKGAHTCPPHLFVIQNVLLAKRQENGLLATKLNLKSAILLTQNPSKQELKKWIKESGLDIKRWFNTSGLKYKELNLKDKLPTMSDDEKIELLSTDGMLVKKPIIITDKGITTGFKEEEWKKLF